MYLTLEKFNFYLMYLIFTVALIGVTDEVVNSICGNLLSDGTVDALILNSPAYKLPILASAAINIIFPVPCQDTAPVDVGKPLSLIHFVLSIIPVILLVVRPANISSVPDDPDTVPE